MGGKELVLSIVIILVVIIGCITFYIRLRNMSCTLTGVEYQIGSGHNKVVPVKITIDGKLQKSFCVFHWGNYVSAAKTEIWS